MSNLSKIYWSTRPPVSDPCEKCKNLEECDAICINRARWWDVRMEKIRKELEANKNAEPDQI